MSNLFLDVNAQKWHGMVRVVELVLDHEVVELIEGILSLVSLRGELLQQPLEPRVVVVPPLGRVQKCLRVHQVLFDFLGVEAELLAGHIRGNQVIGELIQQLADRKSVV